MTFKLFKYDFEEMFSSLWKLGAVLFAITLITGLSLRFLSDENWLLGLSFTAEVILVFAFLILVLATLVMHFYRKCFGKQGYLTFTLPVRSWEVLLAEMLASFCVIVLAGFFLMLCLFIIIGLNVYPEFLLEFSPKISEIMHTMNIWLPDVFQALFASILSLMASLGLIYLAISIGQLFINHRVAAGFIAYFILQTLWQFLSVAVVDRVFTAMAFSADALFLSMDLSNLIIILACFFGSTYIMNHRLNLK